MNILAAFFVFCLGMLHHLTQAHSRNDCFEYNQRRRQEARQIAEAKRIARHTKLQQTIPGKINE